MITSFLGKSFLTQSRYLTTGANAPKRICVVGAGPAGFYAAQYILKQLPDCAVDVIEKLPVPFGLVRFGVAPDHPEVKNVINTFTKTAGNARFRFYGNVCLGEDISLQQLRQSYHAVLLTYGADQDRRLNIPNEDRPNVLSARDFVAWYNGLPGAEHLNPDLSGRSVAIVGQGNVAVDVARMLLSPLDALSKTDITAYALDGLSRSKVQEVYLVGRRGPLQVAFTIKELREMLRLPDVVTIWRPEDFAGIAETVESLQRPRKRLVELMLKSLKEQPSGSGAKKRFLPIFRRSPLSLNGQVMSFSINTLEGDRAVRTAEREELPADMVLRSIGYKSTCIDTGICFDENSGRVFNENGRVLKSFEDRSFDQGLYVGGWLGTGPTGVILTTMNGAFAVAKAICDDILTQQLNTNEAKPGVDGLLRDKRVVTWQGWERIDKTEVERGKAVGKPREKIVEIEEMLKVAGV